MLRPFSTLFLLASLVTGLLAPINVSAQTLDTTTLVADKLWIDADNTLTAQGHVEILHGTTRIKATRIVYSGVDGSLRIDGPITLTEGDEIIVLASSAEMDSDLQNGILRSARMVLGQQLQLAATEIHRVNGRYTQLYKTVTSSCQICANNPVPLWEIRARRIIHDQQERQLYFDNAVLRLMDIPIFYLPRLRLPDPSLKRATGFLVPTFSSSSNLGWGLKSPYFIKLGDHADLTVTPFIATKTKTIELGFRRAFRTGDISFQGAFSNDDVRPDKDRGYFFGEGRFDLPRDYTLDFDLELTSDRSYLQDYGFSSKDRLDSAISISRTKRDQLVDIELVHHRSLRNSDNNDTLPKIVGNLAYHQRFEPGVIGGEAGLRFALHSHYRSSTTTGDLGRDLSRASLRLDWKRKWLLRGGIEMGLLGELNYDFYDIHQGLVGELKGGQFTPVAAVELRWPLVKTSQSGVSHLLEPVLQLVWSDSTGENIADEDSRLVEFDEGNLYSLSRFPGADRYERGARVNLGLTWTRYDPKGWSLGLTVGRILRLRDLGQFNASTGLSGSTSDWLTSVQLKLPNNLNLTNRAIFDNDFSMSKNETRLTWQTAKLKIATSYLWMEAEPYEDRLIDTSEWTFDTSYQINTNWTGKADWRYDFFKGEPAYAGLGLEYRNECVKVDLSLSRSFTSSGSLTPTTTFGFTVSLTGFGLNTAGRARSCHTYN
ncbi:hypothetical protein JI58_02700 [Marinosulfonomonas sp. PRT-SC04]|nr:hypothetical protein JI58_02700 [Marinosulfonomonas sp. PRT-SC04]